VRDLRPRYSHKPSNDEAVAELKRLRAGAIGWLERCRALTPMDDVDADTRAIFRAWWTDVVRTYENVQQYVSTYASTIGSDLGNAINHTIRCMAEQNVEALDEVPLSYLTNIARQNHWKIPRVRDGQYRHFNTALHQMLGYGSGPQNATEEHLEDILLLQMQGDRAFFDWHANRGCTLHFWIDRDALDQLDFAKVAATYECD
jgi:uncharacterized protein YwqG